MSREWNIVHEVLGVRKSSVTAPIHSKGAKTLVVRSGEPSKKLTPIDYVQLKYSLGENLLTLTPWNGDVNLYPRGDVKLHLQNGKTIDIKKGQIFLLKKNKTIQVSSGRAGIGATPVGSVSTLFFKQKW
ncbi:Uncharacterised protein [Candidatus Norongarragalina meridionalis]|nr:Uncharacterised protein [Candidatus Norongarragalina meridionalis]